MIKFINNLLNPFHLHSFCLYIYAMRWPCMLIRIACRAAWYYRTEQTPNINILVWLQSSLWWDNISSRFVKGPFYGLLYTCNSFTYPVSCNVTDSDATLPVPPIQMYPSPRCFITEWLSSTATSVNPTGVDVKIGVWGIYIANNNCIQRNAFRIGTMRLAALSPVLLFQQTVATLHIVLIKA